MNKITYETSIGRVLGIEEEDAYVFSGIPYARAERFAYCERIDAYEGTFDATKRSKTCPQYRQYHLDLSDPERLFYHKEFREGLEFQYDEDCLDLNIYVPKGSKDMPVLVFFHGGGFNSGCNEEEPFRGYELVKRGILTVFANYRVGVLGYFCHEEIEKKYGRNGNFGLDDQLQALRWVKEHIGEFGGDSENITVMGQSAGAISIQYLCLDHDNEGLFQRAVMMSGGGAFPKFALPKKAEETYDYWHELMALAGCDSFERFRESDLQTVHDAYELIRKKRKDSVYNMMPVVDGFLLKDSVDKLIKDPLKISYMIGHTNCDLYAPVMAYIGRKFAGKNGAYVYYFDIDQPGDDNRAFHSCDLRYMFGRLHTSWRPFRERDYEVSGQMMSYLSQFCKKGDPNEEGLPLWRKTVGNEDKELCFTLKKTKMGKPSYLKMLKNMLEKGAPKA
ncbi:MAG: carboxylesterase family protein [Erysipelotrichaceae bacterium]|nr:carboxylesterase family protein [Erysipelotrichaceae bacterium]